METKTLYTLRESKITFDPTVPCLIGNFIGFLDGGEFKMFMEKALELMKHKMETQGNIGWLPNLKESDAVPEDDLDWAATHWAPRVSQAGMKYLAFVLPKEEFELATMNADTFEENMDEKEPVLNIRRFKDEESAKIWLSEVLSN